MTAGREVNVGPPLSFVRLSTLDIDEILGLLNETWPVLYGSTGCPHFTADYLRWLYGGPEAAASLILGCRSEGVLVGLKAYLYRAMRHRERDVRAHISTHLTIATGLPFGTRMSIAVELAKAHTLQDNLDSNFGVKGDAFLAFFESGKTLARTTDAALSASGIQTSRAPFRHAIVSARMLQTSVERVSGHGIRELLPSDMPVALELMEKACPLGLALSPSAASLWHQVTASPHGRAFAAEDRHGKVSGFLACYVLESVRQASKSRVVLIELVAAKDTAALAILLWAAAQHAANVGARGVVIENATTLPQHQFRELGIVPTTREMLCAVRSRDQTVQATETFLCDVK